MTSEHLRVPAEDQMFLRDPVPTAWRYCGICDAEGYDVRPGVGRYRRLDGPGTEIQTVTRCKDATACRQRCEAAGNEWPLVDRWGS
ncbi:MAG: hypothetical protein KF809_14935 [Chloroflexi bacterium]|nr:hypothetical protein [Chloroflexota bacterium]